MIGTTVKIGYDGKAVAAGFKGISKMALAEQKKLHAEQKKLDAKANKDRERSWRQTRGSIGTAAGIGLAAATGGAIAGAKDILGYAGTLNDLSAATKESVDNLIILREAMRLAGAEDVDTGRMITTMRGNVAAATRDNNGSEAEAFRAIGVEPSKLMNMGPTAQFQHIMKAIGKVEPGSGADRNSDEIMNRIFGGRMRKLYGVSADTEGTFAQANKNTADLRAEGIQRLAGKLDSIDESLGRMPHVAHAAELRTMKGIMGDDLGDSQKYIDGIMNGASQGIISGLDSVLRTNGTMKSLLEGVEKIGETIGNLKQSNSTFK